MPKVNTGPKAYVYPSPVTVVGTKTGERENFSTVSYCTTISLTPAIVAIALHKSHKTNEGIKQNQTFSVNIPSVSQLAETDFCGIESGKTTDKSDVFKTFYGKTGTAPMIEEFPVNLECKLIKTVEVANTEVFFGQVMESYADEQVLENSTPAVEKINPAVVSVPDKKYFELGNAKGRAWDMGLEK